MSKQLAFKQSFWNGAAVYCYKFFMCASRQSVDGSSDKFFSCAAFSGDKDGAVGLSDFGNHFNEMTIDYDYPKEPFFKVYPSRFPTEETMVECVKVYIIFS